MEPLRLSPSVEPRTLQTQVTRRGPLKLVSGRLSLATTLRAWRKTGANHIDNPDFDVVCKLLHRIRSRASGTSIPQWVAQNYEAKTGRVDTQCFGVSVPSIVF
uniref:Uncharacterized protein n=1 Tax=Coccidioides posadasii RMSCC 3488 TaxID=454284 RepID=A0A0J6EZ30_COCPO|nr:hypothetical protein CPAG_02174 [Coccidioides posadasii RMSCC 3488]